MKMAPTVFNVINNILQTYQQDIVKLLRFHLMNVILVHLWTNLQFFSMIFGK